MRNILITGASGNVGSAVVRHLSGGEGRVLKGNHRHPLHHDEVYFNFDDLLKTRENLNNVDVLFLLRPPHISDIDKYFKPLISACKDAGVGHIVFLSVQGAEKSSVIPHNKIERLIVNSGLPYTFVRPSYFMQNLTTTLRNDIRRGEIFLPAGNAPFLWIDVNDIGRAIAAIIRDSAEHRNKVYEITGSEYFTFSEVASLLTNILGRNVKFRSPNLLFFIFRKVREGVGLNYALVIMLHYLAGFQEKPSRTSVYTELTGLPPATLADFIKHHRQELQ